MRLGYGLNLEQTQKLIMTPELRQAITILQLSALDLSTYVEEQLLENPMLENLEESTDNTGEVEPSVVEEKIDEEWEVDWQDYFQDQDRISVRQERVYF